MNASTDRLELASRFINNTGAPIFLTGKAGTGKTTFLRKLSQLTHKRFVILAPTGIAALNASGVTIHSQFLLPFGTFLPVREPEGNYTDRNGFFTQQTLARRHPLNQLRRNVLKSVDLLVIDEVSMLRADILDAIDYRMRSVKRKYHVPFGGVQVLFIGDLYQLPPVVKEEEWGVLGQFYRSMHFFEAKALQNSGLIYLELDKIFRQQDEIFIRILNNLRDNRSTTEDVRILNNYYKSPDEIRDLPPCITLTTHNYKADEINLRELRHLDSKSLFFDAAIDREFPIHLYPLPESIELKVGTRIMFIKNDSSGEGAYFNGKLATVSRLEPNEVTVIMDGSKESFLLKKELWENKKYQVNPETKELEEEVIGTFSQFPIKLAWAVTVHKSQGLTFDRAIIDVGQAFAPGQVYVALSRLRSLDGLVLRTRVQTNVVYSDAKVVEFTQQKSEGQDLVELLRVHQESYLENLIESTFEFESLINSLAQIENGQESSMEFEEIDLRKDLPKITESLKKEIENTRKFRWQLVQLLQQKNNDKILERIEKGSTYYLEFLVGVLEVLIRHQLRIEHYSRVKNYQNNLEELEIELLRKYTSIAKSRELVFAILQGETANKMESIDFSVKQIRILLKDKIRKELPVRTSSTHKSGRVKSKGKGSTVEKKEDTKAHSIRLFLEGKKPEEIAEERALTVNTIMGHLGHGVILGKIQLEDLVPIEVIREIQGVEEKFDSLKGYFEFFEGKYDYNLLRLVLNSGTD